MSLSDPSSVGQLKLTNTSVVYWGSRRVLSRIFTVDLWLVLNLVTLWLPVNSQPQVHSVIASWSLDRGVTANTLVAS